MTSEEGTVIVLMGVCGAGKSTVGLMLSKALNCDYLDADDFHSQANKEKMGQGIPLTDQDRLPWLETQREALRDAITGGKTVILGCSSLKKHYREILRSADANYKPGSYTGKVKFVLLNAAAEVLAARMEKRAAEGNHFMPPALLKSQLDSLEIDDIEGILKLDASLTPEVLVTAVQASLFS